MQFENVESDSVVDQRVAISDDENEYFVAEESRDIARSATPRAVLWAPRINPYVT